MIGRAVVVAVVLAGCDRLLGLDRITPLGASGIAPWAAIAAGTSHTCGVRSDGSLWCWGDNSAAQGALGSVFEVSRPARVGTATWTSIAASADFTCGIQTDHSLWCWGRSDSGETGTGSRGIIAANDRVGFYIYETPEPTEVVGSWQSVATGFHHACGIRDDGSLWCWGSNGYGQLGDGTFEARDTPARVGSDTRWAHVIAGSAYTCATRSDSTLWCWGNNDAGQLATATSWFAQPIQIP